MALPTASDVLTLDYIGWSLPQANADVSASASTFALDIIGWSLPQICQPYGGTAPADPTNVVYVNINGTWQTATNVYINVNGSWNEGAISIKTASGWND